MDLDYHTPGVLSCPPKENDIEMIWCFKKEMFLMALPSSRVCAAYLFVPEQVYTRPSGLTLAGSDAYCVTHISWLSQLWYNSTSLVVVM